jgi:hypothetical protein
VLYVAASVIYCNEGGHFMDLHGGHLWILGGHFQLFTSFEAKCAEDETLHECFVPQSKNDEIIRQFKKGNEVNFKIGEFDLYFSLSGFSKAFYRASSLVK